MRFRLSVLHMVLIYVGTLMLMGIAFYFIMIARKPITRTEEPKPGNVHARFQQGTTVIGGYIVLDAEPGRPYINCVFRSVPGPGYVTNYGDSVGLINAYGNETAGIPPCHPTMTSELTPPSPIRDRSVTDWTDWLTSELRKGHLEVSDRPDILNGHQKAFRITGISQGVRFQAGDSVSGLLIFFDEDTGFEHPRILCYYTAAPQGGIVVEGKVANYASDVELEARRFNLTNCQATI